MRPTVPRFRARLWALVPAALIGAALVAGPAVQAEEPPAKAPVGATVPDFQAKDYNGNAWQFSKQDVQRAAVEKDVLAVAKEYGLAEGGTLATTVDSLTGIHDEDAPGTVDPWMRREMVARMGGSYGRITTEASAAALKTLKDVVDWIVRLNGKPTVFICWGPRCPTSRRMNDPIHETLAGLDARVIALGSNYNDTDGHYDKFIEGMDFWLRIVPDREQKITSVLGGERTPHFILVDAQRVLRYRGGLDNDPMGVKDAADKETWLADAVKAVIAGTAVATPESRAVG